MPPLTIMIERPRIHMSFNPAKWDMLFLNETGLDPWPAVGRLPGEGRVRNQFTD
jgi:hypothetical protein